MQKVLHRLLGRPRVEPLKTIELRTQESRVNARVDLRTPERQHLVVYIYAKDANGSLCSMMCPPARAAGQFEKPTALKTIREGCS